ncbi:hypothetical protein [Mesorhizobium sp. RIZ17]|uniref:hypothetical protein n=1 Tax=Mesorhizobium sp. RIZ17 TaxID=3132743 RepID=UPI003DA83249
MLLERRRKLNKYACGAGIVARKNPGASPQTGGALLWSIRSFTFDGTKGRASAFSAAMSRILDRHKAERPSQVTEAERLARVQKNARLKQLRTHASWLVLDPQAHFQEEIDCSALLGDMSIRKVVRDG